VEEIFRALLFRSSDGDVSTGISERPLVRNAKPAIVITHLFHTYLSIYPSIHPSIYPSIHPSIHLSICEHISTYLIGQQTGGEKESSNSPLHATPRHATPRHSTHSIPITYLHPSRSATRSERKRSRPPSAVHGLSLWTPARPGLRAGRAFTAAPGCLQVGSTYVSSVHNAVSGTPRGWSTITRYVCTYMTHIYVMACGAKNSASPIRRSSIESVRPSSAHTAIRQPTDLPTQLHQGLMS